MFTNKKFGLSDSLIEAARKVVENKSTDIQELTGKGKLPAIKAHHLSKASELFARSDKVDKMDPVNVKKFNKSKRANRTVTLKGQELWSRGVAHLKTANRAHDLMYKAKAKAKANEQFTIDNADLQVEIADPAGSPAGGRITGSMDTKSKKASPTGKKDSVEVNPSLKEMTMKERTAFHMAAASAKRLGKSHFMFSGKKFPVKMTGDVAKQMTSEEAVTEERWVDIKTKKFVQAPTREKAAELLNTLPLYIRKAPMQAAESVAEGGMPFRSATWLTSMIRSKQRLERLSDADFAKEHDKKSDDDLRAMAWRHGHGKGSNHYVNKKIRGLKDLEAQKTKSVTEEGKMSDAEVTRAHKIGKHFKKKGIGDEPYALATWLTQKKPGAAKKAEKTIKKED